MPVWKFTDVEPGQGVSFPSYFGVMADQPDLAAGSTFMRYSGLESIVERYTGTGIGVSGSGNGTTVTGGRVSALEVRYKGDVIVSASDLSVSAKAIFNRIEQTDDFGLAKLLLDGNDTIRASNKSDELYGFGDDDVIFGGGGADLLFGGRQNDRLFGGKGADNLIGQAGSDRLYGGSDDDNLYGAAGNDSFYGGSGADSMSGNDGDDLFSGGAGIDRINGGAGEDRFLFNTAPAGDNTDLLFEFSADDDRFVLDQDAFAGIGGTGALGGARFRLGTNATDGSDRIIYDAATGNVWYDKDGDGAAGKELLAVLDAPVALTAGNFSIIG